MTWFSSTFAPRGYSIFQPLQWKDGPLVGWQPSLNGRADG